jgi:hypothetical protein
VIVGHVLGEEEAVGGGLGAEEDTEAEVPPR